MCTLSTKGGEIKRQSILLSNEMLKLSTQPELLMRVLVAVGTLVWEDSSVSKRGVVYDVYLFFS